MKRKMESDGKSCGPQLLATGKPSNEWGLEELGVYAKAQHDQIIEGEKSLTPTYWRLGHALDLAKKAFNHGQWAGYLRELEIDPTRASKARAIYRTFEKAEDVAGLSVEQAYGERERQQAKKPDEHGKEETELPEDVQRLRKFVRTVGRGAKDVVHTAAFAESKEAVLLIPAIRKTIKHLQEILSVLEEQVEAVPAETEN